MTTQTPTLYGIPNCDTVRKTRKWLADNGVDYHFHDYKKQGLDEALAAQFLAALPLETVLNKRGTTWRKLPAEVQESLNATNAAGIISAHPSLVRRPLIKNQQGWFAGYDETQLQSLLT